MHCSKLFPFTDIAYTWFQIYIKSYLFSYFLAATFALTLNPPIERELFVHNKTVLEAVVSGDVKEMVQAASVSCKVKDANVASESITSEIIVPSNDTSSFMKKHKVTIDTNKWFDGEYVTCTIRDTNNNRDIQQKIHFDKGGKSPI